MGSRCSPSGGGDLYTRDRGRRKRSEEGQTRGGTKNTRGKKTLEAHSYLFRYRSRYFPHIFLESRQESLNESSSFAATRQRKTNGGDLLLPTYLLPFLSNLAQISRSFETVCLLCSKKRSFLLLSYFLGEKDVRRTSWRLWALDFRAVGTRRKKGYAGIEGKPKLGGERALGHVSASSHSPSPASKEVTFTQRSKNFAKTKGKLPSKQSTAWRIIHFAHAALF